MGTTLRGGSRSEGRSTAGACTSRSVGSSSPEKVICACHLDTLADLDVALRSHSMSRATRLRVTSQRRHPPSSPPTRESLSFLILTSTPTDDAANAPQGFHLSGAGVPEEGTPSLDGRRHRVHGHLRDLAHAEHRHPIRRCCQAAQRLSGRRFRGRGGRRWQGGALCAR